MGFLAPLFLLGLGAIAVPVVLHLFRRETAPDVPFAAVRYLRAARIEQRERRRIHDWLLLLLRVLALALLAFAFARPYAARTLPESPPVVIAIDTSYSMSGGNALAEARAAAVEAIDGLGGGTPAGLVVFADRATVLAEPTTDHGGLRALVAGVEPGFGGTRYGAALEAARGLLDGRAGRLVIITDLQARGWAQGTASLDADVSLEVVRVGARTENVLVRDLVVRPAAARAIVSNAGARDADVRVTLRRDGADAATRTVALAGGTSADVDFDGPWAPGIYDVSIDDRTGLAADNQRIAVLGEVPPVRVRTLIGDETDRGVAFFLNRAFSALGADERQRFDVSAGIGPNALQPTALAGLDLVIWLSATGVDRRQVASLESYVRDGGKLMVVCGPSLDPRVADVVTRPFGLGLEAPASGRSSPPGGLLAVDPRHPLLASLGESRVALGRADVTRACALRVTDPADVIARFTDGQPALGEARLGAGHVMVLATDLARQWNDLPVLPAFLPLLGEMTTHMLGQRNRRSVTIAEVQDAAYQRPGVWPVGPGGRSVAVNVDVSESDQTRITAEDFQEAVARPAGAPDRIERARAVQTEEGQGLWRYGLMLLAVALVVESILARRPRSAVEVTT